MSAGHVTVDGFTLQNAPLISNDRFILGIYGCLDPAKVTVTNNHLIGVGWNSDPSWTGWEWGVFVENSDAAIKINDNTFNNIKANAILIERATGDVEIGYNIINVPDWDSPHAIFSMSFKSDADDLGNVTGLHWYHNNVIRSDNPFNGISGGITVASAYGTFYGERSHGAYENLVIEHNQIGDIAPWWNYGKGIQLEIDGPDGGFPGVVIRNNEISAIYPYDHPDHKSSGIRLFGPIEDAEIRGNTLTDLYYGILLRGTFSEPLYPTGVEISKNKMLNNIFGVFNLTGVDADARENFWGTPQGPTHPTNPFGTGAAITDYVLYSPWYADEALTIPTFLAALQLTKTGVGNGFIRRNDMVENAGIAYAGQSMTYTFTVENTGSVPLTDVEITDSSIVPLVLFDEDDNEVTEPFTLAVEEIKTFTAQFVLSQTNIDNCFIENTATATGFNGSDEISDTATHLFHLVPAGSLLLEVAANYVASDQPGGPSIDYTYTVTNRGNITVSNILVMDPSMDAISGSSITLLPGASDGLTFEGIKNLSGQEDAFEEFTSQATAQGSHEYQPFIRHRVITNVRWGEKALQTGPADPVGFGQWAAEHGLPEEKAGPLEDASGDGVNNLLKYAFGLDPALKTRAGLPVVTVEEDGLDGNRYLFLTVTKNPEAFDLDYRVQSSADGRTWLEDPSAVVVVEETESLLRARMADPVGGSPKAFLRVKVELLTSN